MADAGAAEALKLSLTAHDINSELVKVGLPDASILSETSSGSTAGEVQDKTPCGEGFTGRDGCPCEKCVASKYKEASGSEPCVDCGPGKYSSVVGATSGSSCSDCLANADAPAGSSVSTACKCNAGCTGPGGGPCLDKGPASRTCSDAGARTQPRSRARWSASFVP